MPRVTTLLPHNAPHDALVACHGADPAQPTEEFLFSRAAREGTPWTDLLNARTIRALSDADPLAGACLRHRLWYGRIIAREGGASQEANLLGRERSCTSAIRFKLVLAYSLILLYNKYVICADGVFARWQPRFRHKRKRGGSNDQYRVVESPDWHSFPYPCRVCMCKE